MNNRKLNFPGSKEINSLFSDLTESDFMKSEQFKMVQPFLTSGLAIFLTVYGGLAVPNLSGSFLASLMKRPLVRVISIALIALLLGLDKSPSNGLLIAIGFMISLQLIDKYEHQVIDLVDDAVFHNVDVNPPPSPPPTDKQPSVEHPVVHGDVNQPTSEFNVEGIDNTTGAPL